MGQFLVFCQVLQQEYQDDVTVGRPCRWESRIQRHTLFPTPSLRPRGSQRPRHCPAHSLHPDHPHYVSTVSLPGLSDPCGSHPDPLTVKNQRSTSLSKTKDQRQPPGPFCRTAERADGSGLKEMRARRNATSSQTGLWHLRGSAPRVDQPGGLFCQDRP